MYRVLIVDDERLIRVSIRQRVSWEDLDLTVDGMAANGVETLDFILEKNPDIVLVDIRMPLMDGLSLIREVRRQHARPIRFLILSGYNDFSYDRQAIQLGVSDYIQKPVEEQDLEAGLRRVIASLDAEYQAQVASSERAVLDASHQGELDPVEKVRRHIDKHYDQTLALTELAGIAHLNPTYLSQVFRQKVGMRLSEYIESVRIAKSQDLLIAQHMSVVDTAAQVGYPDANYFSKVFRKNMGISPTQYQRERRLEKTPG